MNIVYVFSDGLNEFNSSRFRVCNIADALMRAGHKVSIINVEQWNKQSDECKYVCAQADIIHIQRVLVDSTHDIIRYWTSLGKAVCADWDDSYDRILESNAAADFWLHGKITVAYPGGVEYEHVLDKHPIQQFKEGLALCTAGITPSTRLSKDWEPYTPTFVVKNYLDTELYLAEKKHANEHILIGWGGSLSHTQSWELSGAEHAMAQILREHPDVKLFIMGDERVVKQLPVPRDKIVFHPYVPWWHWSKYLRLYDIGLAPLSGEYDNRRSSLKVCEYLTMGIPFVATKSEVYEDFWDVDSGIYVDQGDDKENYDDRVEQWYNSTTEILNNLGHYYDRAIENIEIGVGYDADDNVDTVIETYQEIINIAKR